MSNIINLVLNILTWIQIIYGYMVVFTLVQLLHLYSTEYIIKICRDYLKTSYWLILISMQQVLLVEQVSRIIHSDGDTSMKFSKEVAYMTHLWKNTMAIENSIWPPIFQNGRQGIKKIVLWRKKGSETLNYYTSYIMERAENRSRSHELGSWEITELQWINFQCVACYF